MNNDQTFIFPLGSDEVLHFEITSSRSIIDPPLVQVTFPNGVQDQLELEAYQIHEASTIGCSYVGRLLNDAASSAAVTGCLYNPGDTMEITLISKNNINKMFSVDFYGSTKILDNPFKHGGILQLHKTIHILSINKNN